MIIKNLQILIDPEEMIIKKITGVNRPGTDFGNIKKSSNIKNKITQLSTRILTSLPLLGPAAFATKLLYNEYLKRKSRTTKG